MRWLWLLLFGFLYAEVDPGVVHGVDVVTGHFHWMAEDIRVNGAEPLVIRRAYTSQGALLAAKGNEPLFRHGFESDGGWAFWPQLYLAIEFTSEGAIVAAYGREVNGTSVAYGYEKALASQLLEFLPRSDHRQIAGLISGKTNPKNNRLVLDIEREEAILYLPDGGERIYRGTFPERVDPEQPITTFRLAEEIRPNRFRICYTYNIPFLTRIAMCDPSGAEYAFATVKQTKKEVKIEASDGQSATYSLMRHQHHSYLKTAETTSNPKQEFSYMPGRKGLGARVQALFIGGREERSFTYHLPKDVKEERGWHNGSILRRVAADRIEKVFAPVGPGGGMAVVATFSYEQGVTDVVDSEGLLTRYEHDGTSVTSISYFDREGVLFAKTAFVFVDGKLVKKASYDASGLPYAEKEFVYDAFGNVVEEKMGDASHTFCYRQPCHLLVEEREPNGLLHRYEYHPTLPLLQEKSSWDGRSRVAQIFYEYGDRNLLTKEVGYGRVATHYRRNRQGLPTEVMQVDPAGKIIKKCCFTYSRRGLVAEENVYGENEVYGYKICYSYDAAGRLVKQLGPLGFEASFAYDLWGRKIFAQETGKGEKRIGYDRAGREVSLQEGQSLFTTTYDAKGRKIEETSPLGTAVHRYDALGRCIETKGADGGLLFFSYDVAGNLIETRDLFGVMKKVAYNRYQKPVWEWKPHGAEWRYSYSLDGDLLEAVYPDGSEVVYTYDKLHRMTSKKSPLAEEKWAYEEDRLVAYIDPRGLKTTYAYDTAGRKVREIAGERTLSYAYDAFGFLRAVLDGAVKRVQVANPVGRIEATWEECEGVVENKTTFSYSKSLRKESATRRTEGGLATDFFDYDAEGRLILHENGLGEVWRFHYTPFSKTTIDPLGMQEIERYDSARRRVALEKWGPDGAPLFLETFSYDERGNLIARKTALLEEGKKRGEIGVEWVFNSANQVVLEIDAEGKRSSFAYDPLGRLSQKTFPTGESLFYRHDFLGRLIEVKSGSGKLHATYSYNGGGDLVAFADRVKGLTWQRRYNLFGELTEEQSPHVGSISFRYDREGRREKLILPDQSEIRYGYLGAHLSSVRRISAQGDLLYRHDYLRFDPNGRIVEEKLLGSAGIVTTRHDLLERPFFAENRLFSEQIAYGKTGLIDEVVRSDQGRVAYLYDPLGQVKKEANASYAFNSVGNPVEALVTPTCQLIASRGEKFGYGLKGELIDRGDFCFYAYDELLRLTKIGEEVELQYDPLSRLSAMKEKGELSYFLYDGDREIGRLNGRGDFLELKVVGTPIRGDVGGSVAIELRGIPYAPLHDLRGSIVALVTSRGTLFESYAFDSFGSALCVKQENPWRFCSKRAICDLYFFGARFYLPSQKRWITPDPAGFAEGMNRYLFVRNSPLNRLDLFGLESEAYHLDPLKIEIPICKVTNVRSLNTMACEAVLDGVPVNFVLSSGRWQELKFSPRELQEGHFNVIDHLSELIPMEGRQFGFISVGNGINTSLAGLLEMCSAVSEEVGGTLLIALYNETEGIPKDVKRTLAEKRGADTVAVIHFRQFMGMMGEELHKRNPELLWLHIPHSEHGVITKRALEGMSSEQIERLNAMLSIYAVAPAEPLPTHYGVETKNIYSTLDYITGHMGEKYVDNDQYDVKMLPSEQEWWKTTLCPDHGFLNATYKNAWTKHIDCQKEKFSFHGTTR